MELSYLGAGCIRLATKAATIIVDPYGQEGGLGEFTASADVFLLTQPREGKLEGMTFDSPGEYEVRGIMITGLPAQLHVDAEGQAGTMYLVRSEGQTVLVTGNIAPGLSKEQIGQLGKVDVLVVPVGGHGLTLDAPAAAELVSLIEPTFVIPVHYDDGKTKYAMPQDTAEPFFKELGAKPEPTAKFKLSNRDLPDETAPIYLQRS